MATAVKTKSRKKKVIITIVIVLFSLVLLTGGALVAVGGAVSNGGTIFPNVSVNGIPVGGLTLDQAADRLEGPMEAALTERAVTVEFPGGSVLRVTAEEAGLGLTGYQAARVAYHFGRSGNLFSNSITFLRCQIAPVDLDPLTFFTPDRLMIQDAVRAAAIEMDLQAMGAYEVRDEFLVVVKGRLVVTFQEANLVDLIAEAFAAGAQQTVRYDAETTEPEPVDLEAIHESLFAEAVDAVFDIELDAPTEHVLGITFDLALATQLLHAADQGVEVLIPLILTEPEITTEFLQEVLFRDTLASSTTRLTSDENRNTNIHLAAQEINGMVLNPGEQFDFNTVVGQRTAARGFRPGGAFSGTEMITAIGGGICQVSSTIYHALLHTDIQVDVRRAHTLTVAYLPLGMDAAVAWGGPNFTFTNSTPFPIRIITYRDGLDFHATILGTQTSPYRIVPEGVFIGSIAFSTTYQDDPSLPAGATMVLSPGRNGQIIDVYQRFYDANGNFVRRELVDRSTYHAVPQVVARGTGDTTPPPPPPDDPGVPPPDLPPSDPPPPDPPPPPPDPPPPDPPSDPPPPPPDTPPPDSGAT